MEIDGIPAAVGDDPVQLKAAALNLFNGINIDCIPNDIQAIHRLPSKFSPKPTIIRFTHRSTVENIFKNKNKLKHLNTLNLDINGLEKDSKIFIRPSMCPYFKSLAYNRRILKRNNLIARVITEDDGSLKIKTLQDSYLKITHEKDLLDKFPQFSLFSFRK